jgi:DNA repair photolyase
LIPRLRRKAARLEGQLVSISNSSDPYPRLEAQTRLMRNCLEILSQNNCRVQIITKSNLVVRDVDLLRKVPSVVSLTITTDDDDTAKLIEPCAPPSSERLEAVKILVENGIPTSVRIDPIIPFVNDNPKKLVESVARMGVRHVTSSTYKVKPDNWERFSTAVPKIAEKLRPLYFERGRKMGGYTCLPKGLRSDLMGKVAFLARKYGLKFGTCRENLSSMSTAVCDGSWLIGESTRHSTSD